jgi:uncharacterized tellurite resistance protein B-like protein
MLYSKAKRMHQLDRLLHRKINLLLHLAHIDGKFHDTEKDLLRSLLREKGLEENYLEEHKSVAIRFENLNEIPEKSELLFWVLKLIHADGQLHATEVTFAKAIASQLGFKNEMIDHYKDHPIPSLIEFEKEIQRYQNI